MLSTAIRRLKDSFKFPCFRFQIVVSKTKKNQRLGGNLGTDGCKIVFLLKKFGNEEILLYLCSKFTIYKFHVSGIKEQMKTTIKTPYNHKQTIVSKV